MPRIRYVQKTFRAESKLRISQANEIIAEYQEQGFDLNLRQLYYQFVARDLIPNTPKSYDNLGALISDARLAGLIDWNAIQDRTRNLRGNPHWESPESIVDACADQFKIDHWEHQDYRPEVWIEKEALVGVIEDTCIKLDVPYFSCRGYTSQSEMWRAGCRMRAHSAGGQIPVVLHFGDHDPSGIDMTRDIRDRLEMFAEQPIDVRRIALNMAQIREFNPPPNPAKVTDSRADAYIAEYGPESWELDALDPNTLVSLVETEVAELRDHEQWSASLEKQVEGRSQLSLVADNWDAAVQRLRDE